MSHRTESEINAIVKAYDIRGLVGRQLDAELAHDVGARFAQLMADEGHKTVCVGHDMRPSSPGLAEAFARGVIDAGSDVLFCGLVSTDELYYASGSTNNPGAMFTASHNPAEYNGIKLCRAGARPVSTKTGLADIADSLINGVTIPAGTATGIVHKKDMLADYTSFLRKLVDCSHIRPLKVAVDAGNGMAGLTVPDLFAPLPITVGKLYFELDGTFPNHPANPLEPANIADLCRFVVDGGYDVGLAFDGDADRCFVVDEKGHAVSPSAITSIVACSYLDAYPGAAIIHNLICSHSVPEVIKEHGGRPVRTRVGHSYIKATMAAEHAVFGGEHSAHYYFTEFFNADSGLLAALHVLKKLGEDTRPLSEIAASVTRYAASGEINTKLASRKQAEEKTAAVLEAFSSRTKSCDRLDGVSVELKGTDAWFNLRSSNTEPLLRLNVEARTTNEVDALVKEILGIVRS